MGIVLRTIKLVLILGVIVGSTTSCSRGTASFQHRLRSESGNGANALIHPAGDGPGSLPGDGGGSDGETHDGGGSCDGDSSFKLPTYDVCSGQGAQGGGGGFPGTSVEAAPGIVIKVYDVALVNHVLRLTELKLPALDSASERAGVIDEGALSIPTAGLEAGHVYTAIVCSSAGRGAEDAGCFMAGNPNPEVNLDATFPESIPLHAVIFGAILGPFTYETPGQNLQTFALNSEGHVAIGANGEYGGLPILLAAADTKCRHQASPLVLDLSGDLRQRQVELSAPEDGVLFDILGTGVPVLISWPTQPDRDLFLTLPTADGSIHGVQELFGNNTIGPDGKRAPTGFAALAKYAPAGKDSLDASDPVFSRLRLWSDLNRDGRADAGELFTLEEKGITSLPLHYRDDFRADRFGNQTRERAVTAGPAAYGIFDVWFRLQ